MKKKKTAAALLCTGLLLILNGCGDQTVTVTVTVRNLTESTISEIYFTHESEPGSGENILTQDFPPSANLTYSPGSFTESQLNEGFSLRAVSTADYIDESFGKLILKDGDLITLYMDHARLALALNATDAEIKAMQIKDAQENSTVPADE